MSKKKYITTPIYYVNDVPHIGHAYTTIAADVLARYYRAQGNETFFLTGTDEHGAKIAEAACKVGKEPKEFVDELAPKFQEAWEKLNISYDQFFRTTDPKHEEVVKDFVQRLADAGFVEKKKYEALYCTGCERFYQPDEVVDGKCPDHNRELEKKSEENYFFLLSKFGDKIVSAINKGDIEIAPESRKNEVLGKIKKGLDDVSISRAEVNWGIPFPGDEKQTIYVWVDALINYYSATRIFDNSPAWPADLHLMAKDILWFHAVIWPAMLLALGEELPKKVFAHGFFTIGGKKMSKSLGNVLDPIALADKYGADALRYCLLREFPFGEDGDISEEKIAGRYNSELANGLGNLINRTLNMMNKYQVAQEKIKIDIDSRKGGLPEAVGTDFGVVVTKMSVSISLYHEYIQNMLAFDACLIRIMFIVDDLNKFIENTKPWELAKSDINKCSEVLLQTYNSLFILQGLLAPFMPVVAEKINKQLETLQPEPLFPRIEEK